MIVRLMSSDDIEQVSKVHKESFSRQLNSSEWIKCNFQAYPRIQMYVVENAEGIHGYIQWIQKSGFRPEAVIELEQLAVQPNSRKKGLGEQLIIKSLELLKQQLLETGCVLKSILVSTRTDNEAQKLYQKILGAEVAATISQLYSADEVFMVAKGDVLTKKLEEVL